MRKDILGCMFVITLTYGFGATTSFAQFGGRGGGIFGGGQRGSETAAALPAIKDDRSIGPPRRIPMR